LKPQFPTCERTLVAERVLSGTTWVGVWGSTDFEKVKK